MELIFTYQQVRTCKAEAKTFRGSQRKSFGCKASVRALDRSPDPESKSYSMSTLTLEHHHWPETFCNMNATPRKGAVSHHPTVQTTKGRGRAINSATHLDSNETCIDLSSRAVAMLRQHCSHRPKKGCLKRSCSFSKSVCFQHNAILVPCVSRSFHPNTTLSGDFSDDWESSGVS